MIELHEIHFLAIDIVKLLDFYFVVSLSSFVQLVEMSTLQNDVQFHVLRQFIDSTSSLFVYFAFCS